MSGVIAATSCLLLLQVTVTRSVLLVPDTALIVQTGVRVEIDPMFTQEVLIACYADEPDRWPVPRGRIHS